MKILIATDGSDCARHALQESLRLLPMQGAEVAVVAVTPPFGVEPMAGMGIGMGLDPVFPAIPQLEGALTRKYLAEAETVFEAKGLHPQLIARLGDPATEIIKAAEGFQADVVVLGAHHRGMFGRLFMGSVSDAVSHSFAGATLIVHLPDAEAA